MRLYHVKNFPDDMWVHSKPCGEALKGAEGSLAFRDLMSSFYKVINDFRDKSLKTMSFCSHDMNKVVFEAFFEAYKDSDFSHVILGGSQ